MNIFNNINQNDNTTIKGKTNNGIDDKDLVNFEQLSNLDETKLDKDNSEIMFFEPSDEINNSVIRNLTIPQNTIDKSTITSKSQNSNTVAWASNNFIHAIYNDNYVTIQTSDLRINCIQVVGKHFVIVSNNSTVQTAQGTTKMFDLRTLQEVALPTQIQGNKRHHIKYLKSINKVAFVRLDVPNLFLLSFDNIFSKVVKTEEITLNSTINSPLIEANRTHLFLMNKSTNNVVSCIKLSDGLLDTTLSNSLGTTFNNKQIFDLCYVNGNVVVSCKMSNTLYDLCVSIKPNGSLVQLPITTNLEILSDNTSFNLLPIGKNLLMVQLCVTINANNYTNQMFLFDVINNTLIKSKTFNNKKFVFYYDAIFNNENKIFDYSFNEITHNIAYLISASKPLLLTNRTTFNDYDVINYGELINILQNSESIISDDSFFVKTISNELGNIDVLNTLKFLDNKFQLSLQTPIQNNTLFKNSWAKLEFVNGQYTFTPIHIEQISQTVIEVTLLTNNIDKLSKITVASLTENTTTAQTKININRKTNGYKIVLNTSSLTTNEYNTIVGYVDSLGLNEHIVETDNDNYSTDLVNYNSQIYVLKNTSTNNIISNNVNVFTNMGDGLNTEKNKKSSTNVFYCTFGNESNNTVNGSFGNGLFMFGDGSVLNGGNSEIVATLKIALNVSRFMKENGCTFKEAIYFLTNSSSNGNYNKNIGYGSINYSGALSLFDSWIKYFSNKFKSKQTDISLIEDNSLISKNVIPYIKDNIYTIHVEFKKGTIGTKLTSNNFVLGNHYIVQDLIYGDDLYNVGYMDMGLVFEATGTSATTLTTTEVFNYTKNLEIISTNIQGDLTPYIHSINEYVDDENLCILFHPNKFDHVSIIGVDYTREVVSLNNQQFIMVMIDIPTNIHKILNFQILLKNPMIFQ